ncbi:MAG: PIG-L family deacetylase [Pirellulales bacterium]
MSPHRAREDSSAGETTSLNQKSQAASRPELSWIAVGLDRLNLPPDADVLDIGCQCTSELLKRGWTVCAMDQSRERIASARHALPPALAGDKVTFHVGTAEELDFDDNTFDLILAPDALRELKWPRWALQQLHRVLKPRALLAVASPRHRRRPSAFAGQLQRLGFEVVAIDRSGLLARLLRRDAGHLVWCRKREEPRDVHRRVDFADTGRLVVTFERQHGDALGRLKRWLDQHPLATPRTAQPMEAGTASAERLLVLSPHPDDEVIGCGGTLLKLSAEKAAVTIVQMTDGRHAAALRDAPLAVRTTIRLEEAARVAHRMGAELIAWNEEDRHLQCDRSTVGRLVDLLVRIRPTRVFVPFVNDPHPDHVVANRILAAALEESCQTDRNLMVLGYEVWSLAPINRWNTIDEQIDAKLRLLMEYRTGMKGVDYVDFCRSLGAYRGVTLTDGKRFVEGFFSSTPATYRELVRSSCE